MPGLITPASNCCDAVLARPRSSGAPPREGGIPADIIRHRLSDLLWEGGPGLLLEVCTVQRQGWVWSLLLGRQEGGACSRAAPFRCRAGQNLCQCPSAIPESTQKTQCQKTLGKLRKTTRTASSETARRPRKQTLLWDDMVIQEILSELRRVFWSYSWHQVWWDWMMNASLLMKNDAVRWPCHSCDLHFLPRWCRRKCSKADVIF